MDKTDEKNPFYFLLPHGYFQSLRGLDLDVLATLAYAPLPPRVGFCQRGSSSRLYLWALWGNTVHCITRCFPYKGLWEKLLSGNWFVFILGTQCDVCQIVFPLLPWLLGSSEPHSWHSSEQCLLEICPPRLMAFVLVSYCCCNKMPQTLWLETTQIYLTFWRPAVLTQPPGVPPRCTGIPLELLVDGPRPAPLPSRAVCVPLLAKPAVWRCLSADLPSSLFDSESSLLLIKTRMVVLGSPGDPGCTAHLRILHLVASAKPQEILALEQFKFTAVKLRGG